MTVAVNDIIRVVAEWDIPDGTIAQLVWHMHGASGASATDAVVGAAVLAALEAAWLNIDQDVSDTVTGSLIEIYRRDLVNHRWDGIDSRPITAADGTDASSMISHGAAGLFKIFTSLSRRQGRKYLMGMTEGKQDDGTLNPAPLTNLALFAAALDNPVTAGALTLNYGNFNTDPSSPFYETFATASGAVQAEGILAYQRRRRPGTGI